MAKSNEQKTVDALVDGVTRTDWSPATFAKIVIRLPYPTQWRILEGLYFIVREWRRERGMIPYFNKFLDTIESNPDLKDTEKEFTDGR